MVILTVKNYDEMSKQGALIIKELLINNKNACLGLATGSSPIGIYQNLVEAYQKNEISFKDVTTFNLDEYCNLDRTHPESYYSFMHRNLFSKIDIKTSNINMPDATSDLESACYAYNKLLSEKTIDLQLLGIGSNGHIGFNEPNTPFDKETWIVELTEKTREDNKRFFNSIDDVPTHAITMGIKNIMDAKRILLVASGKGKAEAIKKLVSKEITEEFPASVLHNHKDVIVIVDEEAASLLD